MLRQAYETSMAPSHGETAILELKPDDGIDEATANRSPLLGFNLGGSRPTLILVRCWDQEVDQYRNLALSLGAEQPIISASPPLVEPDTELPHDTEAWVDHFIDLLGSHLNSDGLLLGGWSYSGVVALAMGERLAAQGRPPRLINMIDSTMPTAKARGDARKRGLFHKLVVQLNKALELPEPKARKAFFKRYLRKQSQKFTLRRREDLAILSARVMGKAPPPRTIGKGKQKNPPTIEPLKHAVAVSYLKSRPAKSKLPIALYWTEQSQHKLGDVSLGWGMRAFGQLHCHAIAGSHHGLFDKENVGCLAAAMKAQLRLAHLDPN